MDSKKKQRLTWVLVSRDGAFLATGAADTEQAAIDAAREKFVATGRRFGTVRVGSPVRTEVKFRGLRGER